MDPLLHRLLKESLREFQLFLRRRWFAAAMDPPLPAPPTLSVTVVGSELATTDAYATAAYAMGAEAAPHWLAGRERYEGVVILETDVVPSTGGFPHV